jgi:galactokinase
MTLVDRVTDRFRGIVGSDPVGVWSAPGSVTLIGDHADYNGGVALPIAIDRHTVVAVGYREDGLVRVVSTSNSGTVQVELSRCVPGSVSGWAAYPLGVLWALGGTGPGTRGLDIVIDSDIPVTAGLASSGALVCSVAIAANDVWDIGLDRMELAYAGQRAETDMVGVPASLMDQIASLYGESDSAVFIDCQLPEASTVPLGLESEDLAILVINTTVDRAAAAIGADQLRDVAIDDLPKLRGTLDDETFRRARHVVTENARVIAVADALRHDGPRAIGDFLVASHLSMTKDFDVSTPQLDVAVRVARDNGALGARLTGRGFGGSTIALAPREFLPAIEGEVRRAFADSGFDAPDLFVVTASRGAHRVY